jgi:DNA-directed RNA polymerase specialized sigma24 family protein
LHVGFTTHPTWGSNEAGEASLVAVVGLAQRRLEARVIDELRKGHRAPEIVDFVDLSNDVPSPHTVEDLAKAALSDLLKALAHESVSTQAVVVLAGAGFSAPEIGAKLDIAPAAARQRLSRFGRRARMLREVA